MSVCVCGGEWGVGGEGVQVSHPESLALEDTAIALI